MRHQPKGNVGGVEETCCWPEEGPMKEIFCQWNKSAYLGRKVCLGGDLRWRAKNNGQGLWREVGGRVGKVNVGGKSGKNLGLVAIVGVHQPENGPFCGEMSSLRVLVSHSML
jgi:hypothetical protein